MKGICVNRLLCTVRIYLVRPEPGVLVEARYSTEHIVEKKEL